MSRYSIRDLEKLSGIKAHTIRIWEQRYNLIAPQRTETNIRFYTDADLKRLMNISILNRNGVKISNIARLNDIGINEKVLEISRSGSLSATRIENLIVAMLEMDEQLFGDVLNLTITEDGFEYACEKVLFPFLERIGTLWLAGSVNPAQEHFISNLVRQKIISATDKLAIPLSAPKLVFYLPEGEFHEIGLLYYHYVARSAGFNTLYLGFSLPYNDLLEVNRSVQAYGYFTSFVTSLSDGDLQSMLERLQKDFPGKRFFLSGRVMCERMPKLPANFNLISSSDDFRKLLITHLA